MRRIALVSAAIAASFALAACGGDDGDGGGSDEDDLRATVTSVVEFTDASACQNYDIAFLEEQTGAEAGEALELCESATEEQADDPNDNIEITEVAIDGDTATAEVTYENDGEGRSASYELERDGDDWLVTGEEIETE